MPLCLTPRIERIAQAVTGRSESLFADDVARDPTWWRNAIGGKRILVAGGAGSIGSATIHELLAVTAGSQPPAALAVLDPSENNLAELVRSLRSRPDGFSGALDIQPLDYGSALAAGWMARQAPFDLVLSFAALKHVRSERDEFSLCRMLEVNLVKADRVLAACRRQGHGRAGIFFVSTDKAANPVSLMGASKRAMELLLWAHAQDGAPASLLDGGAAAPAARITTTRFANVAFSDGSLPWGFLQRLEKDQPLAAPGDVRRYLVSPREAGQLCLLAALRCPHRHLLVPELSPERDLVTFTAIAEQTLRAFGKSPQWCQDEVAARSAPRGATWPVLVTTSDTSGEKDIEEFIGRDERAVSVSGLASVQAIPGTTVDLAAFTAFLRLVEHACVSGVIPAKQDLIRALAAVVPGLAHQDTGRSLDSKM